MRDRRRVARRVAATAAVPVAVAGVFTLGLRVLWPAPPEVWIQGAVLGTLIALPAMGIGLVYRTTGVINLAQADLGIVPVTVFAALVTSRSWDYLPALAVTIVIAALLGWTVERLAIRRFSRSPRLLVTVATFGLGRLLAGAADRVARLLRLSDPATGDANVASGGGLYDPPFEVTFRVGVVEFGGGEVFALLVVAVVVVALTCLLRFASTGLALRALADGERRATTLGLPVPPLRAKVWSIAAVLGALGLVLRGGLFGLPADSLFGPTFLLTALAAAVLGRLERLPLIFAASIGIGILELSILWDHRSAGLIDPIMCAAIVAALLLRRPEGRDADEAVWRTGPLLRPLPKRLRNAGVGRRAGMLATIALVALGLLAPAVLEARQLFLFTTILALSIATLSLVVLTGWAGEITLGQMALVAAGSVAGNVLAVRHGVEPATTVLVSAAAGAGAGALLGLIALSVRGVLLAVTTLALGIGTSTYLLNDVFFPSLAGDAYFRSTRPALFGVLPVSTDTAFFYVVLGVLLLALVGMAGMRRARTARAMAAVRENAAAAASFGLSATRTRVAAFAVSGALAGACGGLLALQQLAVPEDLLGPMESLQAVTMTVLGGLTSLLGAVAGTVFVMSARWFANGLPGDLRDAVVSAGTGGGILLVLMLLPGGVAPPVARLRNVVLARLIRGDGSGPTELPASARFREQLHWRPRRREAAADGMLRLSGVDAAYGRVRVLSGVDLEVMPGETVALLGPNGSGKSTVLRGVSGLVAMYGDARYDGRSLRGLAPHRIARLGVMHVPTVHGLYPSLTIAENLRLVAWVHGLRKRVAAERMTEALGRFPELASRLGDPAGDLSGGQQRILGFAMASVARPRLLLVDELAIGLSPNARARVIDLIHELRAGGTGVLLVEQSVEVAGLLADRAVVLDGGRVRFRGSPGELPDRPELLPGVFLGEAAAAARLARLRLPSRRLAATAGGPVLAAEGLRKAFGDIRAVDDVSVRLERREILGLVGPNGAGKSTLLDLVSGAVVPDAGIVRLDGEDISRLRPHERARRGLGRSFQDAALFGALTVRQAISVALERHLRPFDPVRDATWSRRRRQEERWLAERTDAVVGLFGLSAREDDFVGELSTGGRRVLDIACQVAARPRVLLLDEPSAGLSMAETKDLARLLLRVRKETEAALLVVDHDLALLAEVCDRVALLREGRHVAEVDAAVLVADPTRVDGNGARLPGGDPALPDARAAARPSR